MARREIDEKKKEIDEKKKKNRWKKKWVSSHFND